jgi:hypothetical protein
MVKIQTLKTTVHVTGEDVGTTEENNNSDILNAREDKCKIFMDCV